MATTLRLSGWTFFLAGLGLFLFMGSFEGLQDSSAPGHLYSVIGMGSSLLGMLLTSSSRLLAHFDSVRRLKERVREQTKKSMGNRGKEQVR